MPQQPRPIRRPNPQSPARRATAPARPVRARGRRTSRNALAVYAAGAAMFLGTAGFLGVQVATGQDPALNARTTSSATTLAQASKATTTAAATTAATTTASAVAATTSSAQPAVQTSTS